MSDDKVIDRELSLKLANQNIKLAKNLLTLLVAELPAIATEINAAYEKKDYETILRLSHRLHGACCYCGVPRLKQISLKVETLLKSNPKLLTDDLIKSLDNEIKKLISEAENFNFE